MTTIREELKLDEAGVEYIETDPFLVSFLPDAEVVRFYRSVERTCAEIAHHSPGMPRLTVEAPASKPHKLPYPIDSNPSTTMRYYVSSLTLALLLILAACGEVDEPATDPAANSETTPEEQIIHLTAGPAGYSPQQIELKAGLPARLVITRTAEADCIEHIQIPSFDVEKTELPLEEPVEITFTPDEEGSFQFVCGMDMQEGTIVVEA